VAWVSLAGFLVGPSVKFCGSFRLSYAQKRKLSSRRLSAALLSHGRWGIFGDPIDLARFRLPGFWFKMARSTGSGCSSMVARCFFLGFYNAMARLLLLGCYVDGGVFLGLCFCVLQEAGSREFFGFL